MLPNLYIAGTQKSGTTSLFDWLAQHPSIFGPLEAKDYPFFSKAETFASSYERFAGMYRNSEKSRWRLGADANVSFASGGIDRMLQTIPEATIIVLLRKPSTRCVSAWRFARERAIEQRTFSTAISEELQGQIFPDGSYESLQMNYIGHSLYSDALEKLNSSLPKDKLVYLIYEEFFENPNESFSQLLRDLGVDDNFAVRFRNTNKTANSQRSRLVSGMLYNPNRGSMAWRIMTLLTTPKIRAVLRRYLRRVNRISGSSQENVDASVLDGVFDEEILKVEKQIGRKIDAWR